MDNTQETQEIPVVDAWVSIQETADTIRKRAGADVMPFRFVDPENEKGFVVGYIKKPDFHTLLNLWSMVNNGNGEKGASALLESNLVKPESDSRISQSNIKYWFGACLAALQLIEIAIPEVKKK